MKYIILLFMVTIIFIVFISASILNNANATSSISSSLNESNNTTITENKIEDVYMLTTRLGGNLPVEVTGNGYKDKYEFGNISKLRNECPAEVAIFVHGWHNNELKAEERLDRVKMSLENNTYNIPLIGLSWDSNKDWDDAKIIAKNNGPKLAKFITTYVDNCNHQNHKDVSIRLISHSLGARVLLSTLESLHTNSIWNENNYKIASVHLMGAAVDDEEVSKNSHDIDGNSVKHAYGEAIQQEVNRFYNLHNHEDNMLQPHPFKNYYIYQVYPFFEKDNALGHNGKAKDIDTQNHVSTPPYYDVNVKNQIPAFRNADGLKDTHFLLCLTNAKGICEVSITGNYDIGLCGGDIVNFKCGVMKGDNHGGYMGFRDPSDITLLKNDGAIDIVVGHWINPLN